MDVTQTVVCPVCELEVAPLPNLSTMRIQGMCRSCAAAEAAAMSRAAVSEYRASQAAQELKWPTMRGDDVAHVLGISTENLRQLVHRKQITPKGRAGKWSYFDTDDVLELCLRRGVTLVHTPNSHTEPAE